ncbi:hypothetical protein [Frigoriflavimonas asaccharolytica]|uniref:Uncharacterized protein n=1 Tax=Frigoriflavimonas asaccharolytica TaxID=2735899 RepID=A0A8J8KB48_9FLAO|nr:hypothetical protein [Frigoriflavimonas asaccharolytica]NRS92194.1 hypothetical protein [Frigoriflavimonas asaccharolytica]
MKKFLYLFINLPFLIGFVHQQAEMILWDLKRPLKYEDFKVVQRDTIKIGNTGRFKGVLSEFKFKFNTSQTSYTTTPKIEVLVYFGPNKSWLLLKTETTLEHEQIHFNIAELYARKMRKSIDSLNNLNVYNFQIHTEKIDDWNKKYNDRNIKFDFEIDSRVYYLNGKFLSDKNRKQTPWKEKIDRELKTLEIFISK